MALDEFGFRNQQRLCNRWYFCDNLSPGKPDTDGIIGSANFGGQSVWFSGGQMIKDVEGEAETSSLVEVPKPSSTSTSA